LNDYIEKLESGKYASSEDEICNEEDLIFEYVFTGLRKLEGISIDDFNKRFGIEFKDYYSEMLPYIRTQIEDGYMLSDDITFNGGKISLSIKGIDISNSIMAEFSKGLC
jgi:oxygen-independent coproporphyrinogen-3 oxidase